MDLLKFKKSLKMPKSPANEQAGLAEIALKTIHDGVVMTDKAGIIQFINPAAITMTECGSASKAIGLDYGLVIKLESKEGRELSEQENPLTQAMRTNQPLDYTQLALISLQSEKRIPVAIAMHPADGLSGDRIIIFRNITKELEEEGEQTEFISTASHEMRTPVATIDGYLSLCLNPQTAAIDERARGYLTAAQQASKHLGQLFQDLLDVTKLDDGRIRPHFQPVEMGEFVKSIANDYLTRAKESKINFKFGSNEPSDFGDGHRISQAIYSYVDVNFMREILDNLIENALKYTPEGGSIYVNVRGDGDQVLINVTDTGIGISADDLGHIFQKFYRADNSDTREIGGTGLGLYLVKQRVEAMGGRVWAESAFGEGSTFFVSLPRLSEDEYNKRMIAVQNFAAQPQPTVQPQPNAQPQPAAPTSIQPAGVPQVQVSAADIPSHPTPPATPRSIVSIPSSARLQGAPTQPVNPQPDVPQIIARQSKPSGTATAPAMPNRPVIAPQRPVMAPPGTNPPAPPARAATEPVKQININLREKQND